MNFFKIFLIMTIAYTGFSNSINADDSSQEFTFEGKPIGPECLNLWERPLKTIRLDTDACQKNQKEFDPQKLKDGFIGYSSPDGTYIYYKSLGLIHFQGLDKPIFHLVYSEYSGGGTGQFTSIDIFRLGEGTLRKVEQIDGGDRCNGGLEDIAYTDGVLTYKKNVSPVTLYELSQDKTVNLPDLLDCAVCCIGKVFYKGSTISSFEFNKDALESLGAKPGSHQSCVNDFMKDYLKSGNTTLTFEELKEFGQKVKEQCLKEKDSSKL